MSKRMVKKAIQILEEDGWCKHRLHNSKGQHCVVGAIEEAKVRLAATDEEFFRTTHDLRLRLDNKWHGIDHWNDTRRRTYQQVIDKLEELL